MAGTALRSLPLPALLLAGSLAAGATPSPAVQLEVEPREATVGDRLQATLTVELTPGTDFQPASLGPRLGPFAVYGGGWKSEPADESTRWVWRGEISAFETGQLELPPIRLEVRDEAGATELTTEPLAITIRSVLEAQPRDDDGAELADLKPPVAVAPDYRTLRWALGLLAALLLLGALLWWLKRRYGARLAAVPAIDDPFHRVAPHEWVYRELQKLLERRLAEQGEFDLFYGELARISKRYLGGRYRVDLLERTTAEVPELLRQAGAPDGAATATLRLLERCDRVKFARERPDAAAGRAAVEAVYAIVDQTRPRDVQAGAA